MSFTARAQPGPPPPFDPLAQLQTSQPSIEIISNATATATFDPPIIRAGGKAVYRVSFNALEDSIRWPRDVFAPLDLNLKPSARGQVFLPTASRLVPQTTFNHRVHPAKAGEFTVPQFTVNVYGRPVTVPAAKLRVVNDPAAPDGPAARLEVEFAETNLYAGQPVSVQAMMAATPEGVLQALQQFKLTGEGFVVDAAATRHTITPMQLGNRQALVLKQETLLTPIVSGKVAVTAQGFTAGNRFDGPIVIQGPVTIPGGSPQYLLVDSEPVMLNVKPLPRAGQLPGFTGAIGIFTNDPPRLWENQVRVGDVVKMEVAFRGDANVTRLVMPQPPQVSGWQIFPATAGGLPFPNRPPVAPGTIARFNFTLIPLTNGLTATPKIPFSFFDPKRAAYVDLSIPSVPLTVRPGPVQPDWPVGAETNTAIATRKNLALSSLATTAGRSAASLQPLQHQAWFILAQLFPVLGFTGLWLWDKRRRYLEKNPDIVLRRRARRDLRRERRTLQRAARAGDTARFANAAVSAMRVACAPHYPAEPRALVGRDVLELFEEGERSGRTGEVIRKFFSFADASQFASAGAESNGLISLQPELERVLEKLEARL